MQLKILDTSWLPVRGVKPVVQLQGGSFHFSTRQGSFLNAPGVISQRARAVTSCLHFVRAAAAFILQRAMVLTFCSPGFWVSWFLGRFWNLVSESLGFSVSWFLGLLVSRFLGFWVSWFLGFSVSWLLRLLVSGFLGLLVSASLGFWVSGSLGFCVSWFLGLLVSRLLAFLLSEFLVWVLNVTP